MLWHSSIQVCQEMSYWNFHYFRWMLVLFSTEEYSLLLTSCRVLRGCAELDLVLLGVGEVLMQT